MGQRHRCEESHIDLSRSPGMTIIVRNKESQVANTLALVSEILQAGCMEPHAAASLRGIILFHGATDFLGAAVPLPQGPWLGSSRAKTLDGSFQFSTRTCLNDSYPFCSGCDPVIICTDGAYEKGVATIGGTIVEGELRQAFGGTLPY